MDAYKPKGPVHGWRELAGEIGIIVIGVLIALGAEQGVQALHWRHLTELTRNGLKEELTDNLASADERRFLARCQRDRLTALRDRLLHPGPGWAADPLPAGQSRVIERAFTAPNQLWGVTAWSNTISSGALDHLSRQEAATYAQLYDYVATLKELQGKELDAIADLSPLAYPQSLSGDERRRYLTLVSRIDDEEHFVDLAAGQLLQSAEAFDLKPLASADARKFAAQRASRGACVARPTPAAPANAALPDQPSAIHP